MKLSRRLPWAIFKNVLEQSQFQWWRNGTEAEPEGASLSLQKYSRTAESKRKVPNGVHPSTIRRWSSIYLFIYFLSVEDTCVAGPKTRCNVHARVKPRARTRAYRCAVAPGNGRKSAVRTLFVSCLCWSSTTLVSCLCLQSERPFSLAEGGASSFPWASHPDDGWENWPGADRTSENYGS